MQQDVSRDELKQAVHAAAHWYATLQSPSVSSSQQRAWQVWLGQAKSHQLAWQQVEFVQASMSRLPPEIALPALKNTALSRRDLMRRLAMVAVAAPLGVATWRQTPWQEWQANYTTNTGDIANYILSDGSHLALNTASAVDVVYNEDTRLITLYKGEVLIQTAPDAHSPHRPFVVATPNGRVLALGTRFTVRVDAQQSRVTVLEKAVRIHPLHSANSQNLSQGQELRFTSTQMSTPTHAAVSADGWLHGHLTVVDMPLHELLAELSRYRPGLLHCSNDIAELKISGAFPLRDTDRAIAAITLAFPVQARRFSPYWVRLSAA
ncbi:FecR domain-containing protein [Zhongshania aliphaticivorans]|uniref:FecR domain-containing protein n=1 Tax=Zhongshania aliphaticivorans TaxID=1470434 RepID=UPI0012E47C96|nr:FecR domain-containing protein [Zhongshania aliphaticivorans]CAA0119638.1 Protein FecR [Zhongshania aliphaticivorans]